MKRELCCLLHSIESSPLFMAMKEGIHGRSHARRVMLFSHMLADLTEKCCNNTIDRRLLLTAALLHDCGRENDGEDLFHGDRSARLVLDFLQRSGVAINREKTAFVIRYHCKSGKFNYSRPPIEAKIVADADKLDRFRFLQDPAPLNLNMLELSHSFALINTAAGINGHRFRYYSDLSSLCP